MRFHRTAGQPARWLTRVLAAGFGLLALDGLLRAQQSIVHWRWLEGVGLQPGPLYLLFSGLLLAGAGLAGLWAVLRGGGLAAAVAAAAAFTGAAWYWADRLFISSAPGRLSGAVFSAVITALGLAVLAAWLTSMRRSRNADSGTGN